MRILIICCAFAALVLGHAAPAAASSPYADHPLIGSWRFDVPNTRCAEIYRFRADGTSVVTSGQEIAESEFQVSATPSGKGFYAWTDTIVKDNGKLDCSGQVTDVGRKVTNYIRFDPSGTRLVVCRGESLDACFGPLRRIGGQAI